MCSREELQRIRQCFANRESTADELFNGLLTLIREYYPAALLGSWFDIGSDALVKQRLSETELEPFLKSERGPKIIKTHEETGLRGLIANADFVYQFENQNNADFRNSQAGFLLLYVSNIKPLRAGLFFPAYWEQSSAHDRRLPTSLRNLADRVRYSLREADQELPYSNHYEDWGLRMWPSLAPSYTEDDEKEGATILDEFFQTSASAAAMLLATLYVTVRRGKLDLKVLATGVGVNFNELIGDIRSVGTTLSSKIWLAQKFMSECGGQVKLFVPAADFVDANVIAVKNQHNTALVAGKQLELCSLATSQSTEKILDAILPLRAALQAKPKVDDPISSQEAYYTSRSTQDDRSRFHVEIMQDEEKGHLLPKLRTEWEQLANTIPSSEFITISLVSRSWEFPILDCRVIKPKAAYWLLLNDQGDSVSALSRLKEFENELGARVIEINVAEVLASDARENLLAEGLAKIRGEIKKAEIQKNCSNAKLVFNFSSGPRNYSLKLLEEAPNGAFLTVYRGQSDPVNNLPLVGATDLILYHKNEQGIVQRYQPATTSKAAVAAEE